MDIIQRCLDGLRPAIVEVMRYAAGHDDVPHQSMPESGVGCAQDVLAQYVAQRVHQCEGGIVADRPDVTEMVRKALEYVETHPDL